MNFLIDTNVFSELRKGRRANANVRAWVESVPDESMYLSVLVVGEIRQGIERCRRRDPDTALHLERWLDKTVSRFGERIIGIDAAIADLWGRLNVPDPLPTVDGLLAATAMVHEMTLVTRNTADVARCGVLLLDPFDSQP